MHHRVRIYEQGPASVLRYEETPEVVAGPAPGEVRLRQKAIGLNFVDTMFRDGTFAVPLPFTPGVEGAGIVDAVGPGVADFIPGDRVAYFYAPGAYEEIRDVPAAALIRLPEDIGMQQAAALLAKGLTAWMAIRRAHALQPGEVAYVTGATGSVGSLLARWAQREGATVIAAVSDTGAARARELGLRHVVVPGDGDLAGQVRAVVGRDNVDVVYEFVGRATFAQSAGLLREGGTLVHVGNASGAAEVDHHALAARRIHYVQPATPAYVSDGDTLNMATQELWAALRSGVFGDLKIIHYPLADVARAHEDIAQRRLAGLAVLVP